MSGSLAAAELLFVRGEMFHLKVEYGNELKIEYVALDANNK